MISLIDSTTLRWIDEINNITDANEKAEDIQKQIRNLKKQPFSINNRKEIKRLYIELDRIQFHPNYMCLIIDKPKDFDRANSKGFIINGKKYVRLLGTNGGIKNSTVVYVTDDIFEILDKRLNNGRDVSVPHVPAKFESYKALACSGSIPVSDPKGVQVS